MVSHPPSSNGTRWFYLEAVGATVEVVTAEGFTLHFGGGVTLGLGIARLADDVRVGLADGAGG